MNSRKIIVIACVILLAGCASYGTPEERLALNKTLPEYSLCEKLVFSTHAPDNVRAEWATELQNRGKDCTPYTAEFSIRKMQNSAAGAALLNYSGQMLAPRPMNNYPTQTNCRQMGGYFNCSSW